MSKFPIQPIIKTTINFLLFSPIDDKTSLDHVKDKINLIRQNLTRTHGQNRRNRKMGRSIQ